MKAAAVILMGAFSLAAQAAWVEVARNDEFAVFQDPAADRAQGAVVHTMELRNYTQPRTFFTGNKLGSQSYERQYDCAARTSHYTRTDLFESPMGEGKPFDWNVTNAAPWQPVAGDAPSEEALKAACLRIAPAAMK